MFENYYCDNCEKKLKDESKFFTIEQINQFNNKLIEPKYINYCKDCFNDLIHGKLKCNFGLNYQEHVKETIKNNK